MKRNYKAKVWAAISCLVAVWLLVPVFAGCAAKGTPGTLDEGSTGQEGSSEHGASIAGQTPQPVARLRAEDFFPAEPGMSWVYDGWGNEFAAYRRTATHRRGDRAQIVHASGASVAFVYEIDPHRVILRGIWAEIEDEKIDHLDAGDEFHRVILQEPLAVGAEWRTPTWVRSEVEGGGASGVTAARQMAEPVELAKAERYVWETRRVEAVGETLVTPAGTFRNVLRVRVVPDVGVESLEYYAPGIGLIKTEYLYEEEPIVSSLSSFSIGREETGP